MNLRCMACGAAVSLPDRVGFRDVCIACKAYLHACVQCASYVKESCAEPQAEKVRDPRAQNFCEWYRASAGGPQASAPTRGKAEAEALWKKLRGR